MDSTKYEAGPGQKMTPYLKNILKQNELEICLKQQSTFLARARPQVQTSKLQKEKFIVQFASQTNSVTGSSYVTCFLQMKKTVSEGALERYSTLRKLKKKSKRDLFLI
jgi:hypothetical protein